MSGEGGGDVGDDLAGALVVGDEVLVDGGHAAGGGRVGVAGVPVGRGVHAQDGCGACVGCAAGEGRDAGGGLAGCGDGVSGRADVQADEVVELVASVGGGGKAEPAAGGDLFDGVGERGGRDVVAFVGDDEAVAGGEVGDVGAAGEGLQGEDVDGAAEFRAAAAELAGGDAEEFGDAGSPLVGEGFAVDQDSAA